jgi:nicotinamide-nucleotide amidase
MNSNAKASVITIGDELLIGQTIDTNSAWIAQRLNALGIDMVHRVAVGDNVPDITDALDAELERSQIVIVTGGLGPTADDITKPLLLQYFGGTMRVDERVLEHVRNIFARRNRPMLDRNLKQAEVPDSCEVLFNERGTAPGMLFHRDGRMVISLPGVPYEMMGIMEQEALPRILARYAQDTAIVHHTIVTAGEGESFIAEAIADIENALPAYIKLAYLPGAGMVKLRLTGKGYRQQQLQDEITNFAAALTQRLGHLVVSQTDEPLEYAIARWCATLNATFALAESCTGGLLAHLFTQIPSISHHFAGGVVCYTEDAKVRTAGVNPDTLATYGAVSEPVACQMAAGIRAILGAQYALAVTGFLGPATGTENQPIGTIWIAVDGPQGTIARKHRFYYDRQRNKEMAASMALLLLWRYMNGTIVAA